MGLVYQFLSVFIEIANSKKIETDTSTFEKLSYAKYQGKNRTKVLENQ